MQTREQIFTELFSPCYDISQRTTRNTYHSVHQTTLEAVTLRLKMHKLTKYSMQMLTITIDRVRNK